MTTNAGIYSDLAIPPGEYLEEVIRELGMTKDELAQRMNRPASKLSPIFKGEKAITPETALQLEKVVGVPAHIWTGLEAEYRLTLARQEEAHQQEELGNEADLVSKYCYNQLVKLGALAKHTRIADRILELRKFFGVTSLDLVPELRRYQAAFRCAESGSGARSPEAVASWLRLGEMVAQRMRCEPFDKVRLEAVVSELRGMTRQQPDEFQVHLRETLASAGVALVTCPHLPGTKAHGATFRIGRDKAVLMITLRYKWSDIFWFSLFHEIGHLLFHDRHAVILEDGFGDPETARREQEASQFAADHLIFPRDYRRFVEQGHFDSASIQAFAQEIGIHAGIVVGRLQHDKNLSADQRNHMRTRYAWVKEP